MKKLAGSPANKPWPSWSQVAQLAIPVPLLSMEKSGQKLGVREAFLDAIGDLDGDGDLDVFVANMDRPNEAWLCQDRLFLDRA